MCAIHAAVEDGDGNAAPIQRRIVDGIANLRRSRRGFEVAGGHHITIRADVNEQVVRFKFFQAVEWDLHRHKTKAIMKLFDPTASGFDRILERDLRRQAINL